MVKQIKSQKVFNAKTSVRALKVLFPVIAFCHLLQVPVPDKEKAFHVPDQEQLFRQFSQNA